MECPYCGNTKRFTDPKPLCSWAPPDLKVPQIQKCRVCDATLTPQSFVYASVEYAEARASLQQ